MRTYDIAIIGTGSGNTLIDQRYDNKHIAICEQSTFGGTCLNVGCIPTKMFVYTAEVARSIQNARHYGLEAQLTDIHWPEIVQRVFGRIDPIAAAGKVYRRTSPNIDVYSSHTRFGSPLPDGRYVLYTDDGDQFIASKVVIAAGARPVIPAVITHAGVPYYTSDTIMRISQLPERLTIIGGGFIATEFAHVFSSLGVEVSIITLEDQLLTYLDKDFSQRFTQYAIEDNQWIVHRNTTVTRAWQANGSVALQLDNDSIVYSDALLVATGRTPNGDLLDAPQAGIKVENGRIIVDEFQRTTAKNIFALGDVSSPYLLKHVANHEARIVQHNLLCDFDDTNSMIQTNHRYIPSAVFTHPQIATVGLTEQQAIAQGYTVAIGLQHYKDVAYGWAMEDTIGMVKLIADKNTHQLLGAHIMGYQASILIQSLIQAMNNHLSIHDIARGQYWIHPALSEVIENALLQLDSHPGA